MTAIRRARLLFLILICEAALLAALASFHWHEKNIREAEKLFPLHSPRKTFQVIKDMTFDGQKALAGWEEKIFKGKTIYQIFSESNRSFLKASSYGASSGLYLKMDMPATPNLFLAWEWRVVKFPRKKEGAKFGDRSQDDFAARVYVVFPGRTFFSTNVIEYLWDETIPENTFQSSPFSDRIKLFVIRSGPPKEGVLWLEEERNIYEDYQMLFGKPPDRAIGAVAIMSDSDNTQTLSEADFRQMFFKTKNEEKLDEDENAVVR
ncbi:MAG: DUF3047 domain-containing protein [Candidatus Omnitrophica bacterium]|nr:DUF3047 domain-containing protein [Candidatus Omnitrophota bacterium]